MLHKHEHTHEVQAPPKEELIPAILQEIGKLPDAQRHEFLQMLANEDNVIDVEAVSIDPDAPWGRKKDGTPKAKPGVKEKETPKHLQTAYAIEDNRTELQKRLDSVKAKKLAKLRKEATSE